ncbi:MAG TPA: sigma-70 family RNA polymerase sigma factor [Acidimicrobiales bacterium]|nr:sigma-70 family RNA polymerase sigma factor [Acidimicrobiales bacterium]
MTASPTLGFRRVEPGRGTRIMTWFGRGGGAASSDKTDEESLLVERAKVDAHAFGMLYDRHVDGVYRFVYSRLRNRQAAEDVTSDVFVKALRALGRFEVSGRPFKAWLYQIASNATIDHVRALRLSIDLGEASRLASAGAGPEEMALGRVEQSRVWALVGDLPPAQQTALALRLGEDMSTMDIAYVMGKSEGAVKVLVHRGLASLRARLTEDGDLEPGR